MYWQMSILTVQCVAFACLVVAAVSDLDRRIIPNKLVLAVMVAGVMLRLLTYPRQLWISLVIWAGAVLILGLLAVYALAGWGDVKLIAAVTLLVPPADVLPLVVAILIMGGAVSCLYLGLGRMVRQGAPPKGDRKWGLMIVIEHEIVRFHNELRQIGARRTVPYAVAILGGVTYQGAIMAMRCWPAISC